MKKLFLILTFLVLAPLQAVERLAKPKPYTQLFEAVAAGNIDAVKKTFKAVKTNPNIRDENGNTLLHYADGLPMVAFLVENGVDVNAKNNEGIARLHIDVVFGHLPIVKYLLEKGADRYIADNNKVTPLHLATTISYFEDPRIALGVLLGTVAVPAGIAAVAGTVAVSTSAATKIAASISYQLVARTFARPASSAVAGGATGAAAIAATVIATIVAVDLIIRNQIVKLLLNNRDNQKNKDATNAQDINGNTPLHTLADGPLLKPANRHGGVIMATTLLAKGADRTIENKDGQTPYDVAVENRRLLLLDLLRPQKAKTLKGRVKEAKKVLEKTGKDIQKVFAQ